MPPCGGRRGQPRQRPAHIRVPPPSLMAQLPSGERPAPTEPAGENKGRHTLGAVGQESSEETSVASKMPSRVSAAASVGAERCPPGTSAPRRGFLTENSPQDYFPIFLRLLTLPRPWGRCPPLLGCRLGQALDGAHRAPAPPATFEKVDETFTRLRRARELIIRTGVSVAHRPKARLARGATPANCPGCNPRARELAS